MPGSVVGKGQGRMGRTLSLSKGRGRRTLSLSKGRGVGVKGEGLW